MPILIALQSSRNYKTKTTEENEQALSLEAGGVINISIGGVGRFNIDNIAGKIVPIITCSLTTRTKRG
jgi:hypothetical protein